MYFIMCCWAVIYIFIAVQIKSAIDIHALKGLHLKDDQYSCALGSLKFYLLSAFGGLLSCGLTHTAMVPLDLIKCRMQANPLRYTTLVQSFRLALADDGIRSLTKGWVATFIGYCLQGTAKFGFYEVFKDVYSHLLGQYTTDIQNTERAPVIPHALYFLCDICLFPWFATCVHNSINVFVHMPNLTTTDIPMAMLVILFFWTAIYVFIVIQIKTAIDIHAIHHAPLTEELYSCKLGTFEYFFKSAIGGLLACGLTYTAMVPLDLIKCRMQTNPLRYVRVLQSFRLSVAEGGPRCLATGWVATFIGYSINGMAKFGFYEIFKEYYFRLLGEEHAYLWRTTLYLFASATAEFIAAILLAPMEAVKVRMQTQPQNSPNYVQLPTNSDSTSGILGKLQHSIQLRSAPNSDSFLGTLLHMWDHEGLTGFYKGLVPLWLRQIPYTMMKFASFERVNEFLYTSIIHVPKAQVSKPGQLLITFAAGYIAGMFCAAVSQPADTVVSKLNSQKDLSILDSLKELGFLGVWKGFLPRLIMIGTLTGLQWFIYDSVKVYFRLPRPPPPVMPASLLAKKLL